MRRALLSAALRTARGLALTALLSGCVGMAPPEQPAAPSLEFDPPAQWESAVLFSIADSTRFPEFPYGARVESSSEREAPWVVTGRDLFQAPNGELRTPWYPVSVGSARERVLTLRVVVVDTAGAESVAEYPLTVERGLFYEVHLGVATRQPSRAHAPPLLEGVRFYPVTAGARRAPGDSLVVGYKTG